MKKIDKWIEESFHAGDGKTEKDETASKKEPVDDELAAVMKMNEIHAVIDISGRVYVLKKKIDQMTGWRYYIFQSPTDFHLWYAGKTIRVKDCKGNIKRKKISNVWLKHPARKEYEGIIFEPEIESEKYLNLFCGWDYEPKPGDWSIFQQHIFENVCKEDKVAFRYLIAWIARIFQNPGGERPGVAVVLKGECGTGKGVFGHVLGKIIGKHFLQMAGQHYFVRKHFNSYLKDVILFLFDDLHINQYRRNNVVALERLITDPFTIVNRKGQKPFTVRSHLNMVITLDSNSAIPAMDKDRFFCLEMGTKNKQDNKFFGELFRQMDAGGYEGLLHDMLEMDISGIDLSKPPRTECLIDQTFHSLPSEQKFIYSILNKGTILSYHRGWANWEPLELQVLHKEYLEYCKRINERNPKDKFVFSKKIRELLGVKSCRPRNIKQRVAFKFPSLNEARSRFERRIQAVIFWSE